MGYERLEKSLTDTIKEEQAKLGFRKEAIRLYYPLEIIIAIFRMIFIGLFYIAKFMFVFFILLFFGVLISQNNNPSAHRHGGGVSGPAQPA